MPKPKKTTNKDFKPKVAASVQIACIFALVALVGIDAFNTQFEVGNIVYAIIGGVAFGVGGKDVVHYLTGGRK